MKDDEFILSLSDFFRLFSRKKKFILSFVFAFALLASFYKLTRPVTYSAEALFKEKNQRQAGFAGSLFETFVSGGMSGDAEAISMIKSRKVMDDVVKNLHLQAILVETGSSNSLPKKVIDNLKIEYAHFKKKQVPLFPEGSTSVSCEEIHYEGEIPIALSIRFNGGAKSYQVYDSTNRWIGKGQLGRAFITEDYAFTLKEGTNGKLGGKKYTLSLIPLATMSKAIAQGISVEADKKVKHLLEIRYTHPNRHMAKKIVNTTMASYQQSIANEHHQLTKRQLEYLQKRKGETLGNLVAVMDQHADNLSQDIHSYGFMDTESELRFLLENQLEAMKKLNLVELDNKRLTALLEEETLPLVYPTSQNGQTISAVIDTLRDLKQQRDSLSLTLHEKRRAEDKIISQPFHHIQHELDSILVTKQEVYQLIDHLQTEKPLGDDLAILHDTTQYIGSWYQQNQILKKEEHKQSLVTYLQNLVRMYDVYAKILQERLTHEFPADSEYQGIDLETANQIYLSFMRQVNELEGEQRQYDFVTEELADPKFEIASLSTTLQDPISRDMIAKASNLSFMLRDESNRSPKEQERIQKELTLQKAFLQSHLEQTAKVVAIRQEILREKIASLQGVMLEMINEKISILENHIRDNVAAQIRNLEREKELVDQHLAKINQQMQHVPKKWVSENMVKQNVAMAKTTVEELTRLVEGKNIAHNLDVVMSSAVDTATAPILPNRPNLLKFSLIGGFIGAFLSIGLLIIQSIYAGVDATQENLSLSGHRVCGEISFHAGKNKEPIDSDLETIRRLATVMENESRILLIKGKGPNYSSLLATLLAKQGKKVLILPATFKQSSGKEGMLQYLEGEKESAFIQHGKLYDKIATGGVSRYGIEWTASKRYQQFIEKLSQRYDSLIFIAESSPCSAESEFLMQYFQTIFVTLSEEKLLKLTPYTQCSDKKIAYIFLANV